MGSARASVMKFLVLLSVVSLASAAPLPEGEEAAVAVEAEAPVAVEEDAPAALPYVHDATGDVAEPYVHEDIPAVEEEIAAEPYVHDITGDVAEAYVHEEVPAEEAEIAPETPCTRKSLRKCMNTMPPVTLPRGTHMKTLLLKCTQNIHSRIVTQLILTQSITLLLDV